MINAQMPVGYFSDREERELVIEVVGLSEAERVQLRAFLVTGLRMLPGWSNVRMWVEMR